MDEQLQYKSKALPRLAGMGIGAGVGAGAGAGLGLPIGYSIGDDVADNRRYKQLLNAMNEGGDSNGRL